VDSEVSTVIKWWHKIFSQQSSRNDYWYYPEDPVDYGWFKRSSVALAIFGILYFANISETTLGTIVIDGVHQVMTVDTDVTVIARQVSTYLPQNVAALVPKAFPTAVQQVDPFKYMSKPMEGKIITPFGNQAKSTITASTAPVSTIQQGSNGIVISAQSGSPVRAAAQGKIIEISTNESGKVVRITHSQELETVYMGLQDVLVSPQDLVAQGQVIGRLAKKSQNNGALYFEVREQGQPTDPLIRLKDPYQ
jgi:murein DD-endopeptidase MepM/ murein hydrolase activator NlpD